MFGFAFYAPPRCAGLGWLICLCPWLINKVISGCLYKAALEKENGALYAIFGVWVG
jgi:hypothetical protein